MAWFHETGSLIGTAVSATFLLAMALVNMVILRGVWRSFQALKKGRPCRATSRFRPGRGDELAVWQNLPPGE
jgi:high-affinity nickel permease